MPPARALLAVSETARSTSSRIAAFTPLQDERARHNALYGEGLEGLSSQELENLLRIHDDGVRQARTDRGA